MRKYHEDGAEGDYLIYGRVGKQKSMLIRVTDKKARRQKNFRKLCMTRKMDCVCTVFIGIPGVKEIELFMSL